MASKLRKYEAYLKWKEMGLKRSCSDKLAEESGISRQALYKWHNSPIEVDGIIYKNWEEAYSAETKKARENYETEIKNKLVDGYKLLDIIADEILMKYLVKVRDENYKPSLDELVKIMELVQNDRASSQKDEKFDNIVTFILSESSSK